MSLTDAVEAGVRVVRRPGGGVKWRGDCVFCQRAATVRDPLVDEFPHHDPQCERPYTATHCGCPVDAAAIRPRRLR